MCVHCSLLELRRPVTHYYSSRLADLSGEYNSGGVVSCDGSSSSQNGGRRPSSAFMSHSIAKKAPPSTTTDDYHDASSGRDAIFINMRTVLISVLALSLGPGAKTLLDRR